MIVRRGSAPSRAKDASEGIRREAGLGTGTGAGGPDRMQTRTAAPAASSQPIHAKA